MDTLSDLSNHIQAILNIIKISYFPANINNFIPIPDLRIKIIQYSKFQTTELLRPVYSLKLRVIYFGNRYKY